MLLLLLQTNTASSYFATSAIPPLVLFTADSKAEGSSNGSTIIADLCAAPGSKCLQLLDMLYMESNGEIPTGLLVANDSDRSRIVTLCQRSRHVPRAPMLTINTDARYFPGLRRSWGGYKQKYDKVLCDVPCSGDGTTRKNNNIWQTWSIPHATSLHRLQRKILRRGMELLRPGGILVYSTCSLNPLENEAVVASVIEDVGGVSAMEIIPLPKWLSDQCGALPGLTTWQVPTPKFGKNDMYEMYQSFDDVPVECQGGKGKGKKGGHRINRSMFPPLPTEDSELLSRQLRHCARFLPSDKLDSGGFFVACIRRLKAGELGMKDQDLSKETLATTENPTPQAKVEKNHDKNFNQAREPSLSTTPNAERHCLREGDWICSSCNEVNFGWKGRARCFGCKARKPRSTQKGKHYIVEQLLLSKPQESVESFLDLFGISPSFPLQRVRVITTTTQQSFVLVSDALSNLAISDSWSPV